MYWLNFSDNFKFSIFFHTRSEQFWKQNTITYLFFSRYGEADREEKKEKRSGIQLLVATFKHMKKPYQLLIIPLTFWSGVEQGFFGADFTAVSFV